MDEQDTYTLVASSNAGRYALDTADGHDLTSGERLEVYLGGKWIRGSIEHTGKAYHVEGLGLLKPGYVFYSDDGGACGLCVGMKVRR